ncbi:MAG TPA: NAD-dependent epimerase/dehydratase family protein [Gemmataceae bacterium]|nr:NAD-dependent epimerase/dehydratase family protein [Gemmataceae bacterium]
MNAFVTGGGGFLGTAVVRRLRERGDQVHSFSLSHHAELDSLGVTQHQGDIADPTAVSRAAAGCDIVFHIAAKTGVGGRFRNYYRTNVLGTANVLAACRHHGITRLVYTSSPSAVFDGRDMAGVDESVPYPTHYDAAYPKTKAIAERMVLRANSASLATASLRPHLIWGPGDNHLIPRILARARAGRLRRLGTESKLIDSVYIDNAADAHVLAADRLTPGSPIAGKVYFITQGEPIPLWDLVNRILHAAGLGPVTRSIPPRLAYGMGWLLEMIYAMFRPQEEPPMTRFVARELTTAHWFDITAAKRDLGYEPKVSLEEGLRRLALWLRSRR